MIYRYLSSSIRPTVDIIVESFMIYRYLPSSSRPTVDLIARQFSNRPTVDIQAPSQ